MQICDSFLFSSHYAFTIVFQFLFNMLFKRYILHTILLLKVIKSSQRAYVILFICLGDSKGDGGGGAVR